jgi:hypothetical protein
MAKRLAQAFVVVFALLLVAAVVGAVATQTAWFKTWLRGYIVQEAHQYLNGELSIGRIRGNLVSEVELEDVGLTINGEPVLSIKTWASVTRRSSFGERRRFGRSHSAACRL